MLACKQHILYIYVLGELTGLVMLIIDIVIKRANILWMPISSMVIVLISILLSLLVF